MHQFGRNIYLSHADWQIAPMWVSQSCWTEKQLMHLLLYSNFLLVNQKSLIEHPLCIAHCTRNYGVGGLPFLGANILGPPMKCWQLVYLVLSDHQHNFMILTLLCIEMSRDLPKAAQPVSGGVGIWTYTSLIPELHVWSLCYTTFNSIASSFKITCFFVFLIRRTVENSN